MTKYIDLPLQPTPHTAGDYAQRAACGAVALVEPAPWLAQPWSAALSAAERERQLQAQIAEAALHGLGYYVWAGGLPYARQLQAQAEAASPVHGSSLWPGGLPRQPLDEGQIQ